MPIGALIQAWRLSKKQSVEALSKVAGISTALLEEIEAEQTDPAFMAV
jgi:transcriptional regulator with XRE-family HTH domain